jgi:uncharacterized protein
VIFVDTSFWIGLADGRDARHAEAAALLRERQDDVLVSSNRVVGETWTFLRRRHSHLAATTFLGQVENANRLEIAFVSPELEQQAWAWLRRHDERPYSFVDATSFAVMRHRRVETALAFDGDFSAAGFIELRL